MESFPDKAAALEHLAPFCPAFHRAVEIIGRRWTGVIIRSMLAGKTRFGEILDTIPGLSDRLLSERLKQLEREGIVVRTVLPDTPVRVEYHLTQKGLDLAGVVRAVAGWAETWTPERTGEYLGGRGNDPSVTS